MPLTYKKILLGITGGIAAYKCTELVRQLRKQQAQVKVIMTHTATQFITPLTLYALSGHCVITPTDTPEDSMAHITLARWADSIIIAPASAHFIAKLAHGLADNLLSNLCLAAQVPILVAPAMNQAMWQNPATQFNIQLLLKRGIHICGPALGEQACGENGPGRMAETNNLVAALNDLCQISSLEPIHTLTTIPNKSVKIIVTAGPTQEAIDPVRYISNHSSGKMGYALASAAVQQGAEVTLISGPTQLTPPQGVKYIPVVKAQAMYQAVMKLVANCDIFIGTAAVADYRLKNIATQKIKRKTAVLQLSLIRNKDILAAVAQSACPPFTVGFAAETEQVCQEAKRKLHDKKINMIVANRVAHDHTTGFNSDTNAAWVFWESGESYFPVQSKLALADKLITLILELYWQDRDKTNSLHD